MANPQGSSFIPKRPTKGKIKPGGLRKIYLLSYISYIFFFSTLIITAGIFFYQISIDVQLDQQKQLLAKLSDSFSPSDLQRIRELENRITTATKRINSKVSVLSIFTALEQSITDPIYLFGFGYTLSALGEPEFSVSALADSFNTILFQKDVLSSNSILQSVDISDVALNTVVSGENESLDTQQFISFSMNATLDPNLIAYESLNQNNRDKINQLLGIEDISQGIQADETADRNVVGEDIINNSETP